MIIILYVTLWIIDYRKDVTNCDLSKATFFLSISDYR